MKHKLPVREKSYVHSRRTRSLCVPTDGPNKVPTRHCFYTHILRSTVNDARYHPPPDRSSKPKHSTARRVRVPTSAALETCRRELSENVPFGFGITVVGGVVELCKMIQGGCGLVPFTVHGTIEAHTPPVRRTALEHPHKKHLRSIPRSTQPRSVARRRTSYPCHGPSFRGQTHLA